MMAEDRAPEPTRDRRQPAGAVAAGAAAGLAGGLVASWLMVAFQQRVWPPPKGDKGSSTAKLVREVAGLTGSRSPSDRQAKAEGELIHYALGAGLGLAYGAAAVARPRVALGRGTAFGAVTELVIDQAIVPALGLANPFWKCPVKWHVRGLMAHLVFGVATDTTRRLALTLVDAAAAANRSVAR